MTFFLPRVFRLSGGRLLGAALLGIALILAVPHAMAEEGPMRLSDWLSARAIAADDYPPGLVWGVPGEAAAQEKLRDSLLRDIAASKGDADALHRLHDWIDGLPVTGRVPVAIVDADWLRANPNRDPLIRAGQTVSLPKRPATITLITSGGMRCQLPHVPGWLSRDYLSRCDAAAAQQVDWAWLIQPDGKVRHFGIVPWNAQAQDEPAPGAWLWMPLRADAWAATLSAPLAAFLATQGVAADAPAAVDSAASFPPEAGSKRDYRDAVVTANDWGEAGLLQMPAARMRSVGMAAMTLTRDYPNTHINMFLQPYAWMELGFRYTSISNRLYGPLIAGGQAYKDKSIDVKFSLLDESAHMPQVAVGFRDMVGTGLFSGEYLVASKRAGAWDASMGLGWGYVGGRGNMGNPLAVFGPAYKIRSGNSGGSGDFALTSYFRGRTALFGGLQYQTRWEPLLLKLEYDGNNYQHEPLASSQLQNSPWNVGAVYRMGSAAELALGFERGNTFMLSFTLQADLKKMAMPKLDDPVPVAVFPFRPQRSALGEATARDLSQQTGWPVRSIELHGRTLRVDVDDADAVYWGERIDRASAVLHRDAPDAIDDFELVYRQRDMELARQRVSRDQWVRQQVEWVPPVEQQEAALSSPVVRAAAPDETQILYRGKPPAFQFDPGFNLNYSLGGPNSFILYEVAAEEKGQWRLSADTWLQGDVQLDLFDNYNKFTYTAPSDLPRVRTHIREYLTSSRVTMPNLQLTHTGKLSENQYYSVYGGYLEMMFAGAGAEWLYRPLGGSAALGIDVNRVRQRDFRQDFYLGTYQVNTGHATLYWDTGWQDMLARLSAGRYLAGDVGMTIDLSRVFQNGVRMGGFFTKTNVPAQQFGEGSFDKGIYVTIPFDAMMTKSSSSEGRFLWQPLIRDGGAKLNREVRLYEMTRLLDKRAMQYRPAESGNAAPAQSQSNWLGDGQ